MDVFCFSIKERFIELYLPLLMCKINGINGKQEKKQLKTRKELGTEEKRKNIEIELSCDAVSSRKNSKFEMKIIIGQNQPIFDKYKLRYCVSIFFYYIIHSILDVIIYHVLTRRIKILFKFYRCFECFSSFKLYRKENKETYIRLHFSKQ